MIRISTAIPTRSRFSWAGFARSSASTSSKPSVASDTGCKPQPTRAKLMRVWFRPIGPTSLTSRVLMLATLWSALALVVISIVISQLYRQSAERAFTDLLRAQLYNVINSITIGDDNQLSGSPQLGDLRFSQPETGWYWIIE